MSESTLPPGEDTPDDATENEGFLVDDTSEAWGDISTDDIDFDRIEFEKLEFGPGNETGEPRKSPADIGEPETLP